MCGGVCVCVYGWVGGWVFGGGGGSILGTEGGCAHTARRDAKETHPFTPPPPSPPLPPPTPHLLEVSGVGLHQRGVRAQAPQRQAAQPGALGGHHVHRPAQASWRGVAWRGVAWRRAGGGRAGATAGSPTLCRTLPLAMTAACARAPPPPPPPPPRAPAPEQLPQPQRQVLAWRHPGGELQRVRAAHALDVGGCPGGHRLQPPPALVVPCAGQIGGAWRGAQGGRGGLIISY